MVRDVAYVVDEVFYYHRSPFIPMLFGGKGGRKLGMAIEHFQRTKNFLALSVYYRAHPWLGPEKLPKQKFSDC